ncbi:MAG: peptidoglycan recognition family protein [Oscillospiraceae bacterium]
MTATAGIRRRWGRRQQIGTADTPDTIKAPVGVMVHSTGANNPNLRRYVQPDDGILGVNPNDNDWNRPGLDVAVHAFIGLTQTGDVAAYQILPWEYRAWHCGGDANDTHVSFEICEDAFKRPRLLGSDLPGGDGADSGAVPEIWPGSPGPGCGD